MRITFEVPKERMITAKWILCSREIDLSTMGANALDSHAKGKNNCDNKKPLSWTALLIL